MKRSEINEIMRQGIKFCEEMKFNLPPFCFWSPEDWKSKNSEYDEIRDNRLGWDITDFGSGDFEKIGLLIVTIRNGNFSNKKYTKTYAEKLLIVKEGQVTPYHYHYKKYEDIINRGGGNLLVKCYNRAADDTLDNTPVIIHTDGREYEVEAGELIRLCPGESITLENGLYHSFWGEEGKGTVLVGEVSSVNDDTVDNRFLESVGRFPDIDEDEAPLYCLAMDL